MIFIRMSEACRRPEALHKFLLNKGTEFAARDAMRQVRDDRVLKVELSAGVIYTDSKNLGSVKTFAKNPHRTT